MNGPWLLIVSRYNGPDAMMTLMSIRVNSHEVAEAVKKHLEHHGFVVFDIHDPKGMIL